jgi:phosphoribosylglycinamide formyltransferase 1
VHIPAKGRSREEFDAEVNSVLEAHGVDIVLLVGFMRILSPVFCSAWKGRAVNVHPSLLPKHAALMDLAVHQSVLDAGDKESGCTVHMVDEVVDAGSIVVQPSVAVDSSDTAESLKAKVQALEAPALVEAVKIFSQNGNKFPVAAASNASDGRANSSEQQVATEVLALSALQTRQGYQQQNDPWNKTDK